MEKLSRLHQTPPITNHQQKCNNNKHLRLIESMGTKHDDRKLLFDDTVHGKGEIIALKRNELIKS